MVLLKRMMLRKRRLLRMLTSMHLVIIMRLWSRAIPSLLPTSHCLLSPTNLLLVRHHLFLMHHLLFSMPFTLVPEWQHAMVEEFAALELTIHNRTEHPHS
uniref:Uncharacterized protein n=1 Tax=Triticum urartu TaxID=4572 RepID=A0A8R7JVR2_TRIUA